jgi:hypothetical protein
MAIRRDNTKMTREDIISKPGALAAKIVFNNLYDDDFNLCFIGNVMGNTLYTVQLNNRERAIVGFTDESLLEAYANRLRIVKNLKTTFGAKIVSVKLNICTLNSLIETSQDVGDVVDFVSDDIVRTLIINPNNKDFFIPIHIPAMSKMLIEQGLIEEDDIEEVADKENLKILEYNKKSKRFAFEETDTNF